MNYLCRKAYGQHYNPLRKELAYPLRSQSWLNCKFGSARQTPSMHNNDHFEFHLKFQEWQTHRTGRFQRPKTSFPAFKIIEHFIIQHWNKIQSKSMHLLLEKAHPNFSIL